MFDDFMELLKRRYRENFLDALICDGLAVLSLLGLLLTLPGKCSKDQPPQTTIPREASVETKSAQ